MIYSGPLSYGVVSIGLLVQFSRGSGDTGVGGIGSGWSGSGVSGGIASANDVSYAIVVSMNSRITMVRSRDSRKDFDGLWAMRQVLHNENNGSSLRHTHAHEIKDNGSSLCRSVECMMIEAL